ncbi:hypothetical protein [Rhodanobacter terrae]|uniref:Uncharacterized protein n=1 Tax=Rhodanobacter terrae TaxID=418647 RepID=A0ABW0SZY0_9GAMM
MSKDKSHKKDKSKKHDLFSLMLEQSEVFREMVAHFQRAWAPEKFLNTLGEAINAGPVAGVVTAKKPKKAAKAATKPVANAAPASKKAAVAPVANKPAVAAGKSAVKKAPGAKNAKPAATKKSVAKTAPRAAKKNPSRK